MQVEMMAICGSWREDSVCRWQGELRAIACNLANHDTGKSLTGVEATIHIS